MKKLLAAAAGASALAALATTAWAADLPPPVIAKAPPPPPAWYDWTGFYVGGNGGYSFGRASTTITTTTGIAPFSGSQNVNGGLGGGQIGYNWQFNHNWVLGIEADIQGTGQSGSDPLPTVLTAGGPAILALPTTTTIGSISEKLPWFGTVRGRLGYEPADRLLIYGTGGLAYGEVDTSTSVTATTAFAGAPPLAVATASANARNVQVGWTVGGGLEYAFAPRWSVKVEYLYVDLGSFTNTFAGTGPAFPTLTASTHFTDNIVRAGINYNFGGPR
jgi:outer membrane immunogenic protein